MQITSGSFPGYLNFGAALSIRSQRTQPVPSTPATSGASRRDLDAITQRLRRATTSLQDVLRIRDRSRPPRAAAVSGMALTALRTQPTSARLVSTNEINTVATSFTPRGPSFTGSSSALPTIGGIYDGDQGDDTLTFTVSSGGVVGLLAARIQVRDGQNQLIQTLNFGLGYQAGTELVLTNGLKVSLASGSLAAGDSFQVQVSTTTGSTVAPDNPFDGTRNAYANFDPGLTVQAGSFLVNGATITVAADDTLHGVLAKINDSAAGVTARFDAVTERIELVQDTPGSAAGITFGSDSSGFLAATKLTGASPTPGLDDERRLPIAQVAALAGITSGSFTVNGVQITIDVLVDSLTDIVARIDEQATTVGASLDATQRVRLTATDGGSLTVDDGNTAFFATVGITSGTFFATEGRKGKPAFVDPRALRDRLDEFGRALEDLFATTFASNTQPAATFVQGKVRGALAAAFGAASDTTVSARTPLQAHGLTLHLDAAADTVFDVDTSTLRRALTRNAKDLATLLGDKRTDTGITGRLTSLLPALEADLLRFFGPSTGTRTLDLLA
jgi:hypothetical protein